MDATVYFRDHVLSTGSGWAPHVEASVRALEILSETCYTIQVFITTLHLIVLGLWSSLEGILFVSFDFVKSLLL